MKISIEETREINITVKNVGENRANKEELIYHLNELSLVYSYAAEKMRADGCDALAKDFQNKASALYKICNDMGAYKG